MMTKLSDTQLLILSAAAQRANMLALPLPKSLKGGAAQKVISSLLKHGLLEEVDADLRTGEHVWRNTGDWHGVTLVITEHGLAALGIEPKTAGAAVGAEAFENEVASDAGEITPLGSGNVPTTDTPTIDTAANAPGDEVPQEAPSKPELTGRVRATRDGTKQAALVAMLRTPEGATISQLASATGWQPHTVRGAMAGALKKRLGLEVTSEKVEGGERIYRLPTA